MFKMLLEEDSKRGLLFLLEDVLSQNVKQLSVDNCCSLRLSFDKAQSGAAGSLQRTQFCGFVLFALYRIKVGGCLWWRIL